MVAEPTHEDDGPPRAALIAAIVLGVAAAVAVLVVAVTQARRPPDEQPLALPVVPAPQAASAECAKLLTAVPQQLGDYRRVTPAEPVPPGAAAWASPTADEPVVMRCGLDRPTDFVVGAPIQVVNAVQWFQATEANSSRSTWFAVDRPVYVALTLPQGSGPTPIQQMSELIGGALPAVPIRPGPPR